MNLYQKSVPITVENDYNYIRIISLRRNYDLKIFIIYRSFRRSLKFIKVYSRACNKTIFNYE